jgi:hypothetical protein
MEWNGYGKKLEFWILKSQEIQKRLTAAAHGYGNEVCIIFFYIWSNVVWIRYSYNSILYSNPLTGLCVQNFEVILWLIAKSIPKHACEKPFVLFLNQLTIVTPRKYPTNNPVRRWYPISEVDFLFSILLSSYGRKKTGIREALGIFLNPSLIPVYFAVSPFYTVYCFITIYTCSVYYVLPISNYLI